MSRAFSMAPFADLADFTNGYAFSPNDMSDSGDPIVRIEQLLNPKAAIDRFRGSLDRRFRIATGDIVMSWSGTITVVPWDRGPAWLNQHLFRVDPRRGTDPRFLRHVLEVALPDLVAAAHGTTMKHIKRGDLLKFRVAIPEPEEQRWIAEILDTIDETIQAAERVIAKLWLAHHGVVRAILRDCDDGRRVSLREVAEVSGGLSISSSRPVGDPVEVPYLRVANVQDGFIDTSTMRTVSVSRADIDRFSVKAGDVLMNEGGDFDKLGRGAVWDGSISPCLHQNHVFRVRCKPGEMVPEFLALFCQSAEGKAYFVKSSKQTTNLASINKSQLGSLPTLAPSIEAQLKVVETQRASVSKVEAERLSLSKLSRTRAGLAADLLSGRVRTVGS